MSFSVLEGLIVTGLASSRLHYDLDRLAAGHRPVAVGHLVEAHDAVEDLAGLDPASRRCRRG
jgi:hypothetical protein